MYRKKSVELTLNLFDLKFNLVEMKLERIRRLIESKYEALVDSHLDRATTTTTVDHVAHKLNAYRDSLNKRIQHETVQLLERVRPDNVALDTLRDTFTQQLLHFRKQVQDAQLAANLRAILVGEGLFGVLRKRRYDFIDFTKYNLFLNLNDSVLNPLNLVKKKLNLKAVDFYYLADDKILFRYVDASGNNCLSVVNQAGNVLYARTFPDNNNNNNNNNNKLGFFSTILDNHQEKICVMHSHNDKATLETYDFRLNPLHTYHFSKLRLRRQTSTDTANKAKESFIWNFALNRHELLVSFRLEVNGLFDLYYLVYELDAASITLKSIISNQSLEFASGGLARERIMHVNKTSCLIYFTAEFFYFINHDANYNRYLQIMFRNEAGISHSYHVINQIKLDDSYEFFFEPTSRQFIAYNNEKLAELSWHNNDASSTADAGEREEDEATRENFRLCQFAFDGHCVYETRRVENLYDLIKFDHFKVYFKNELNIGLANLFREYFASKIF